MYGNGSCDNNYTTCITKETYRVLYAVYGSTIHVFYLLRLMTSQQMNQPAKKPRLLSYNRPSAQSTDEAAVSADDKLANYITAINQDSFDAEQHPHIYGDKEYCCLRPLFSRLFSVPATSAPVESVFSQGGIIMRPHRAKMSDDLLEMLMYLRCNGN